MTVNPVPVWCDRDLLPQETRRGVLGDRGPGRGAVGVSAELRAGVLWFTPRPVNRAVSDGHPLLQMEVPLRGTSGRWAPVFYWPLGWMAAHGPAPISVAIRRYATLLGGRIDLPSAPDGGYFMVRGRRVIPLPSHKFCRDQIRCRGIVIRKHRPDAILGRAYFEIGCDRPAVTTIRVASALADATV